MKWTDVNHTQHTSRTLFFFAYQTIDRAAGLTTEVNRTRLIATTVIELGLIDGAPVGVNMNHTYDDSRRCLNSLESSLALSKE